MILRNQQGSPNRGSIGRGKGDHWGTLPAGADGQVLTTSANDPSGTGLAWSAPGSFSGPIGVNGATPPTQAARPGVAAGTDAVVINAVITILRNLGFRT